MDGRLDVGWQGGCVDVQGECADVTDHLAAIPVMRVCLSVWMSRVDVWMCGCVDVRVDVTDQNPHRKMTLPPPLVWQLGLP